MRITDQERKDYEEPFFEKMERGSLEDETAWGRLATGRALLKEWQSASPERLGKFGTQEWEAIARKALLALDVLLGDQPLELMSAGKKAELLGTTRQNIELAAKMALKENYRGGHDRPDALIDGSRPGWFAAEVRCRAVQRLKG